MEIRFHGLLHVADGEQTALNLPGHSFGQQLGIYLDDAVTLARSLAGHGLDFDLLTNRPDEIRQRLRARGNALAVQGIPFRTEVPSGTRMYSTHFKLDVYRHFAGLRDQYSVLLDLDMLCINPLPPELTAAASIGQPLCYDLTHQVAPVVGAARIAHDLELLHGMTSAGRWFGGEFIAGTAGFFAALSRQMEMLWPQYLHNLHSLHQAGGEVITSAALERLERGGLRVAEAGALELIARHWNTPTRHRQAPLRSLERHFLLHLPGEKVFLSGLAPHLAAGQQAPFELVVREARRPARWLRRLGISLPAVGWRRTPGRGA